MFWYQENELRRKQEAKQAERERKKKEVESKGKNKNKGKSKSVAQEEECIIDNLLKEIKQGFKLKKRRLSSVAVNSPDQNRKLSKVVLQDGKHVWQTEHGKVYIRPFFTVNIYP